MEILQRATNKITSPNKQKKETDQHSPNIWHSKLTLSISSSCGLPCTVCPPSPIKADILGAATTN
jgi:hypothetical protein